MNKILLLYLLTFFPFSGSGQSSVAYYNFDNNVNDQSRNQNHGVIHGNVKASADRFGNPCGALQFDGMSGYIEVPHSATLGSLVNAFTITVWYKIDHNSEHSWLTVLCKGTGAIEVSENPQYRFQVQQHTAKLMNSCNLLPDGSSTISINTSFTKCDLAFNQHLFKKGQWGFYALIYDGNHVSAYMNNKKIFEHSYTEMLQQNSSSLFIGKDEPGNTEYFEGHLDDLSIYNYALNEKQLFALYNAPGKKFSDEFILPLLKNKVVELPAGSPFITVDFDAPVPGQSRCGKVILRQVHGPAPGSSLAAGKHLISYEAVSPTGYKQYSSFYIIVRKPKELSAKPVTDTVKIILPSAPPKDTVKTVVDTVKVILPSPGPKDTLKTVVDTVKKNPPSTKDTMMPVIPIQVQVREKIAIRLLEVTNVLLTATLYDNGQYDGDTVTLYLNGKILLSRQEVNPAGRQFNLQIDSTIDNELLMFADNIGNIPPNTALLVLTDGDVTHRINLSSTLKTSGIITIRKKRSP